VDIAGLLPRSGRSALQALGPPRHRRAPATQPPSKPRPGWTWLRPPRWPRPRWPAWAASRRKS